MQEAMWLSSISLRSDLPINSNEELRSEFVVSFRSRKIQVGEICTLLVDDLEGLCFPALQSAEMFSFASISRPGCKDRLPHGPTIFSPHLQVLPAFIHDVIHDYFTDVGRASNDPKGFIESWTYSFRLFRLFTNTAAVGPGLQSEIDPFMYQLENWKGLGTETGHTGIHTYIQIYIYIYEYMYM